MTRARKPKEPAGALILTASWKLTTALDGARRALLTCPLCTSDLVLRNAIAEDGLVEEGVLCPKCHFTGAVKLIGWSHGRLERAP